MPEIGVKSMEISRKRIALFVGQADEEYQSNFIRGFITGAFGYDMDVCVFSMYHKYQNSINREKGESNIFSLFDPDSFDGLVILEDTIQTAGAADRIEEHLHRTFGKPVLVIEKDSKYFQSIFSRCRAGITELVSHLIEGHGCRDIAFLAGKKWHKHTNERLQAVRGALEQHGLSLPKNRIIYGDFWYQSGELCADTLLSDESGLPDAVVCANDAMAIGLCKAFEERGINVPGDIAIVSYDSTEEGRTAPKPVTSCLIPSEELGGYAAKVLDDQFAGRETEPFAVEAKPVPGETCGCRAAPADPKSLRRTEWGTDISDEGFGSVNNTMAQDLLAQNDLEEFIAMVYSYAFQIKGAKSFHLCLSDKWNNNGFGIRGSEGYPDRMIYAIRYNSSRLDGIASLEQTFETKSLLPGLEEQRAYPRALFFTPVFSENICFGYAAVEYSDPVSYDETYRNWILLVSRCLEGLRRSLALRSAEEQLEKLRSGKFAALNAAFEKLSAEERADYELVGHILDDNLFIYHFQPIVNTVDGGIYSYEALMRTDTAHKVAPLSVIRYADMQSRLTDVERATFLNVLRIISDEKDTLGNSKIFINSIPGVKLSDEDIATVEGYLNKLSDTVVIELTEEAELDDKELERVKELCRTHNVKIAIDDYGTGYSNVSNLLRYMPNYVKIDRALLSGIESEPHKQHFVKEIISFCHDNDILALAEGVETSEELRTVIHLGADLIQGYYTGRPAPGFTMQIDEKIRREIVNYRQEYVSGTSDRKYIAGKTNRVVLSTLVKNDCSEIIVGQGAMIYKDITVYGTPGVKTNVHIRIEPEYKGRVTLENVWLSNTRGRPCIEIGENADVTLIVTGENTLRGSGIMVHESSRLTLEGDGNIKLDLSSPPFCGIGNIPDAKTGELNFALSGTVEINSQGSDGVCIGAGLGGKINIRGGRFILDFNANSGTGIGTLSGDAEINIQKCSISIEFNAEEGCGVGSIDGSAKVVITKCAFNLFGDGTEIVGVGTVNGKSADVKVDVSSLYLTLSAVSSTGIGSLSGSTDIGMTSSLVKIENSGDNALAIGGNTDKQLIVFQRSDIKCSVKNKTDLDCLAKPENLKLIASRGRFTVNGKETELASLPE